MRASRRVLASIAVSLTLLWTGCEKLGVDPSGKLACSPPPRNQCPTGFFCSGGRCLRNGSRDGGSGDAHIEGGGPDSPGSEGDATLDEMRASDTTVAAPDGSMTGVDAEDASATNGEAEVGAACGVCPSPPSNGRSTCTGTTCGIACDATYRNCPGTQTCTLTTACCSDAECPKNTPACVSGQCKARANNDPCAADTECGSGHCAATATGATTKVCCDTDCSGSCNDGCAGGTCRHKKFRTSCGEIDNSYFGPRYYLCDGNGNCNPPTFPCGGESACAARSDVACCGDPTNNFRPGCVAATVCGQGVGNFEQSCQASADCPLGTFCCVFENPDLQITACAANCQTYAPAGFDPTDYAHSQACDYLRDQSCPTGQHCGVASSYTGVAECGL